MNNNLEQYILEDIKEMKADIKLLLAKQNKQTGFILAISAMFTFLFNIISMLWRQ